MTDTGRPGERHLRDVDELAHFHHQEIELGQRWSQPCCHTEHQEHTCSRGLEVGKSLRAGIPRMSVWARARRGMEEVPNPLDQPRRQGQGLTVVDSCASQNQNAASVVFGSRIRNHKNLGVNASPLGLPPC